MEFSPGNQKERKDEKPSKSSTQTKRKLESTDSQRKKISRLSIEDQKRLEEADKIITADNNEDEDDLNSTYVSRRITRTQIKKEKEEEEENQNRSDEKSFSNLKSWVEKNARSDKERKKAIKSIEKNKKKNPRNESSIFIQ